MCNISTPLRDKSHETLHSVTYLATAENVARQVAETAAESSLRFHFLQRFQATLRLQDKSQEPVAKCKLVGHYSRIRSPFLERPGNFSGPKSHLKNHEAFYVQSFLCQQVLHLSKAYTYAAFRI